MRKCSRCGDKFTGEEIAELMAEHEEFSLHPFICPDCFDRLQRLDLEDQLDELIREEVVAMSAKNEPADQKIRRAHRDISQFQYNHEEVKTQ